MPTGFNSFLSLIGWKHRYPLRDRPMLTTSEKGDAGSVSKMSILSRDCQQPAAVFGSKQSLRRENRHGSNSLNEQLPQTSLLEIWNRGCG
jgi:hypothetical protein